MAKEIALPLAPTKSAIKKALTAATKQKKNAEAAVTSADQTIEHLNGLLATLEGGDAPAKKAGKAPAKKAPAKKAAAADEKMTVPQMRAALKEAGVNTRGMKRADLEKALAELGSGKKSKKAPAKSKKAPAKAKKEKAKKTRKPAKKAPAASDESDDSDFD